MQKLNNLIGYNDFSSDILNAKKKATKRTETSKDVLLERHLEKPEDQLEYICSAIKCYGEEFDKKVIQIIYDVIESELEDLGYDPEKDVEIEKCDKKDKDDQKDDEEKDDKDEKEENDDKDEK